MGLLFARCVLAPFLWRRMVVEVFQADGVFPVIHMRINRFWRESLNAFGMIRRSSLGIPSDPGVLLSLSLDSSWLKVYLLVTDSRSVFFLMGFLLVPSGVVVFCGMFCLPWVIRFVVGVCRFLRPCFGEVCMCVLSDLCGVSDVTFICFVPDDIYARGWAVVLLGTRALILTRILEYFPVRASWGYGEHFCHMFPVSCGVRYALRGSSYLFPCFF